MIGIIGATDFETGALLREIETSETVCCGGFEFSVGVLFGCEVVAAKCGIGKVFAAACCQTMLLRFSPERIINIGAAGAIDGQLSHGNVVLADGAVQYDMDTTAFGDPLGMISGLNRVLLDCQVESGLDIKLANAGVNCIIGHCATADRFCSDGKIKDMIEAHFGCVCVDMETAAFAQICFINAVPFEAIRIISDSADDSSSDDYNEFTKSVGERLLDVLKLRL